MSLWEAQMLQAKGRLILNRPFPAWLRQAAATAVAQLPSLDAEVVIAGDALPRSFHGDPGQWSGADLGDRALISRPPSSQS